MKRRTAKPALGKKVYVYRNLHQKCFSVKDIKTGIVIAHVDSIVLSDCSFRVSQAGRQRVLREKKKNVHAGVVGIWAGTEGKKLQTAVAYNPYKYESFVRLQDETPIHKAKKCLIQQTGVSAIE